MGNKKDLTMERSARTRADDLVVYKVTAALVALCVCLVALRKLRSFYGTVGGMEVLDPLTLWIAGIGAAVFVAGCVACALWKNRAARAVLPLFTMVAALAALTGVNMKLFWTQGFSSLYFLCCGMFIQYIILQLYQWEFFLFSLSTISAGFAFFCWSSGFGWNAWSVGVLALTVVVLVGSAVVTRLAAKTGILTLGKRSFHLFSSRFNPALLYLASGLWLACLAAALLLGSLFAYYSMFAAIAVEFIAAVYYTFQLN